MSNFWITGSFGFLGSRLASELASAGHSVGGIGNARPLAVVGQVSSPAVTVDAPVSLESLDRLAAQTGAPDAVFHLAGGSTVAQSLLHPQADFERTVRSTLQLCEWLRLNAQDAGVVYASSAAIYGDGHCAAISEKNPANPVSPYGFNKLAAETVLRNYATCFGLRVCVIRLFSVYGPELRKQFIWDLTRRILHCDSSQLAMQGTGNEMRDWMHVDDAAALLTLAERWASQTAPIINGGTGNATSVRDAATQIAKLINPQMKFIFDGQTRKGDPKSIVADIDVASARGFRHSIAFADGLASTVEWIRRDVAL